MSMMFVKILRRKNDCRPFLRFGTIDKRKGNRNDVTSIIKHRKLWNLRMKTIHLLMSAQATDGIGHRKRMPFAEQPCLSRSQTALHPPNQDRETCRYPLEWSPAACLSVGMSA